MPIVSSELVLVGSASRPENDTAGSGGDEVLTARPLDSQFAATAVAALVSDNAADTMNVTVYGRDAAGSLVNEVKALNGTNEVVTTQTFERIHKVVMASAAAGTVLLKQGSGGTTRHTFAPGELEAFIMFIGAASDPSVTKTRYEKLHWTNKDAVLALQAAEVKLTADPASRYEQAVSGAINDTEATANRLTAPSGETFVDDGVAQSVPGGTLPSNAEIGVWIKQALLAADAPAKHTFTTQLAGTTT